ncbi:hypothetical protein SRABI106_00343 [Rahnella aquatilis]|nr:hypothetical protein SRABI106_00343 [Rahnella aquatilis]
MRDFMGAQGDIYRHAGAHFIAEDFNDFTDRFGTAGRTLCQLDHHHISHACAVNGIGRDQNIKAQTTVVGYHKTGTRIGKVTAHNLAHFRHQNTHDARFTAAFTVGSNWLCQDHVTVDAHFHLFSRQIHIVFLHAFQAQETVTITMADNRAFQQVQTLRQRVALAAGKD